MKRLATWPKFVPITVLVVALAGLAGSGAWAVDRAASMHGNSWMGNGSSNWMMGYRGGGDAQPVRTMGEARRQAQSFADRLDLKVVEVMQFANNYYARLDEQSGKPATEVLIDPSSGRVSIEYGPAMMWNTRYGVASGRFGREIMSVGGMMNATAGGMMGSGAGGMMGAGDGGMMGSSGGLSWAPKDAPVSGQLTGPQAIAVADRWLAERDSSLSVPDADAFPGFYSMEIERNGKIVGMLSVNAFSGAVWNHSWHGAFVAMSK